MGSGGGLRASYPHAPDMQAASVGSKMFINTPLMESIAVPSSFAWGIHPQATKPKVPQTSPCLLHSLRDTIPVDPTRQVSTVLLPPSQEIR